MTRAGLSPERWQQVKSVFDTAVELDGDDRARFLADATRGDDDLRCEVESLLAALADEGGRFDEPAVASLAPGVDPAPAAASAVGKRVGAYLIDREVAHGGMGTVYEAHRVDDAYQKRVAVKMIHRGHDNELILRRFRQERQILARLEHPNIAALLDGGASDDGQPYFAMEYVAGRPIDVHCAEERLPLRDRLALFRQVCDAVQYAHRNLVVHRDLKPGNILVTADGQAKLLDFGIAKLLSEDEADDGASMTRAGLHPLTTAYASPEQVRGDEISTASDVFSLGVVLYELLSGVAPFRANDATPLELQRRITEDSPPRPSTAASADAATAMHFASERRLHRALRGELDTIVMMALRKEPERRYSSVEQFSEDVRRFLEGLPVRAQRDTARYRARKFVQRNRAAVAVGALLAVALMGGTAGTAWQARNARAQARIAETERAKAEQISAYLQGMISAADPSWNSPSDRPGPGTTVASVLDAAARRVSVELTGQPEVQATIRRTIGNTYRALGMAPQAQEQLRAALALHRTAHAGPDPEVALDLHDLAMTLLPGGRASTRRASMMRQSLAMYRALGDTLSEGFLGPLNDLAVIDNQSGQYPEAERLFTEALAVARGIPGLRPAAVAIILGNLGLVNDGQGHIDEAAKFYQQALDAFDSLPGRVWLERQWSLLNLGNLRRWQGRYVEAESLIIAGGGKLVAAPRAGQPVCRPVRGVAGVAAPGDGRGRARACRGGASHAASAVAAAEPSGPGAHGARPRVDPARRPRPGGGGVTPASRAGDPARGDASARLAHRRGRGSAGIVVGARRTTGGRRACPARGVRGRAGGVRRRPPADPRGRRPGAGLLSAGRERRQPRRVPAARRSLGLRPPRANPGVAPGRRTHGVTFTGVERLLSVPSPSVPSPL